MNYIFIGMKHCGKSSHGKAFAEHLDCKFYDTDDLLWDMYNRSNGSDLTVREIMKTIGPDGFRELEEKVMERLLVLGNCNVFSMGGRMPVNDVIQKQMPELGFTVYLKLPFDVLYKRVMRRGIPSFIDPKRPYEHFIEICEEREPYYEKCADLKIELEDMPKEEARNVIFKAIEENTNAG